MIRNQRGQAILITILLLGTILALVVIFGGKRQVDVSELVGKMDVTQVAGEVLSAAARKVQRIYALESGCDPDVLDSRLSRLKPLPANTSDYGINVGGLSYAVAQPSLTTAAERENRCSTDPGCRQFGIPLERKVYVVTAGAVVTDAGSGSGDCPRDATIRLSVAINRNLFHRRVTLINICTAASCPTGNTNSFDGIFGTVSGAAWATITDCNGWGARSYGSLTGATLNINGANDLRWARRYLETGGAGIGDTSFAAAAFAGANASCTAAAGTQCYPRNCVPPLDMNRDKTNNDADIAIFENFLRGYLISLPVMRLN